MIAGNGPSPAGTWAVYRRLMAGRGYREEPQRAPTTQGDHRPHALFIVESANRRNVERTVPPASRVEPPTVGKRKEFSMRTLRRFQRDWIVLGLIVVTLALTSCRAKNDAASGAGESATTGAEGQVATPGEQQAAAKLPPNPAAPCAPGSRCLKVGDNGALNPAGTSLAQCLGTYPDYV